MNIMMSDSLKERVSESSIKSQILESELVEDISQSKVFKIQRRADEIILTLDCDRQLLNKLYSFSIGLVKEIKITSRDLNLNAESNIIYNVLGCEIDYESKIKKIKITLKTE